MNNSHGFARIPGYNRQLRPILQDVLDDLRDVGVHAAGNIVIPGCELRYEIAGMQDGVSIRAILNLPVVPLLDVVLRRSVSIGTFAPFVGFEPSPEQRPAPRCVRLRRGCTMSKDVLSVKRDKLWIH